MKENVILTNFLWHTQFFFFWHTQFLSRFIGQHTKFKINMTFLIIHVIFKVT